MYIYIYIEFDVIFINLLQESAVLDYFFCTVKSAPFLPIIDLNLHMPTRIVFK